MQSAVDPFISFTHAASLASNTDLCLDKGSRVLWLTSSASFLWSPRIFFSPHAEGLFQFLAFTIPLRGFWVVLWVAMEVITLC